MSITQSNIYEPYLMEVLAVEQQTSDVKLVRVKFKNHGDAEGFSFEIGQFGLWSVFGVGESTFNICNSNSKDYLEFCFRKTGRVTEGMWKVEPGDVIGFRGPYGNHYPMDAWEGKNLIFVAGGIAMPPIRCAVLYALENREKFGKITIVYGARSVGDLVCRSDLDEWAKAPNVRVLQTVDPGGETPDWNGLVGFVPTVLKEANLSGENAVALVVGPPIMIKFSFPVLAEMGIPDEAVYTSLENRMKCGLGKCGRCNCGHLYVCKDGPVFTSAQLKQMPADF
ncbi:MAG: FAD/NAD(P)-binding protein [Thermoguttaceae bacterium]|jgi:sulfhydrogenase subunit gamma (sulfur reductase)